MDQKSNKQNRRASVPSRTQSQGIPIQFIPTQFTPKQCSSPTSSGIQLIPTHFIPTFNVPQNTSYVSNGSPNFPTFNPGFTPWKL